MTEERGKIFTIVERFEPFILVALAMTLSMGSVAALVVGLIVLFVSQGRSTSWKQSAHFMVALVGKVVLCLAIGFLMYMAAERARGANSLRSDLGISRFHGDTLEAIWGVP